MNKEILDKLQTLIDVYGTELPNKVNTIVEVWHKYIAQPREDTYENLIRLTHTLAGTAGTYGFTLISEAAHDLEVKLKTCEAEGIDRQQAEINGPIHDLKQLAKTPIEKPVTPDLEIDFSAGRLQPIIYFLGKETELKTLAQNLQQFNYKTNYFDDTSQFINAIYKNRPDMLIIDADLIHELNLETIKSIQREFILIIFTVEKDNLELRLKSVRHGGQSVLVKPFDTNHVLRVIDSLFEASKHRKEKVLIVDDSPFLASYYMLILEQTGLVSQHITDPREFLTALQEFQPDIILLDINMPFCSGIELAQIVSQLDNFSGVPIIFLSSIAERSKQLDLLSIAGDDFLTKPVDPKFLVTTIRNRLMRSRLLRSRMMRDSLTNLYNHTMILNQLEREIVIAERYHHDVSLALIDIDFFKRINDSYGHQAGDQILKELSFFLQKRLRKSDLIGRYGGEEFLIVFPNTGIQECQQIMNDLGIEVSHIEHQVENQIVKMTISGGLANFPRFNTTSTLVKAADRALYEAKRTGRNRIIVAS